MSGGDPRIQFHPHEVHKPQHWCRVCDRHLERHPELAANQKGEMLDRLLELDAQGNHTTLPGKILHGEAILEAGGRLR